MLLACATHGVVLRPSPCVLALLLALLLGGNSPSRAEFSLNFTVGSGASGFAPGNCGIGGQYTGMCQIGMGISAPIDPDATPFYHAQITIDGVPYWHTIVGDPRDGFAMESYIAMSGMSLNSDSGGKPSDLFPSGTDLEVLSGNGWDPLGLDPTRSFDYTGNGSADPNKVVVRQVMGGTWDAATNVWSCGGASYCSEFLKGGLLSKPVVTQTINDLPAGMNSYFKLDMSMLSYSDDSAAATLVNILTLTDAPMGDFDMATDTQAGRSSVTGGRYIYTSCANPAAFGGHCWQDADVYSDDTWDYQEGSYSYVDGGTDPLLYDWSLYWDPDQNPIGSGNEAKCDSGIITGACP